MAGVVGIVVYGLSFFAGGSEINSGRPDLASGLPSGEKVKVNASLQGMALAFGRLSASGADCNAVAAEVREVVGSPADVASSSGAGTDEGREVILQTVALLRQSLTSCLSGDRVTQVEAAKKGLALLERYGVVGGQS